LDLIFLSSEHQKGYPQIAFLMKHSCSMTRNKIVMRYFVLLFRFTSDAWQ